MTARGLRFLGAEDRMKIQQNRAKSPVELEKSDISVLGQVLS